MFSKYRELGLALIPLKPNSKAPMLDAWTRFCDTLPTEEECEKWERCGWNCYGLACGPASGIMFVDIDSDDPAILNAVKPSPIRKRGRKGESRAFRFDPNVPSCKVAGCIDILAYGRQTVLPPTIHPDTKLPYIWLTPDTLENFSKADLPLFTPDDLADLQRTLEPEKFEAGDTSGTPLKGPFYNDDPKRKCPHGSQDRLKRIVTALIARGASPDEAIRELLRYDEDNHKPVGYFSDPTRSDCFADPVSNAIFFYASNLKTFNRRLAKSGQIPAIPLVSGSEFIDVSNLTEEQKEKPNGFKNIDWPEPSGLLKDIRDQIIDSSVRVQPALALGGAIAIASAAIANRLKYKTTWPNVYVINVANTGTGKSFPQTVAKLIFNAENDLDFLGSGGFRSSTALLKDLVGKRERLDLIDECSTIFNAIKNGGIFQNDMLDILNMLWSESSSLFMGPESAGREKIQVWHPCVSVLFSTTPDGLKNSMSKDFITQGFIARTLIFHDDDYGKVKKPFWDEERAKRIVKGFQEFKTYGSMNTRNLVNLKPQPEEIRCDKDAEAILDQYTDECAQRLSEKDRDEMERHFYTRAAQQAVKLAMIHGALSGARIKAQDVVWAIDVLQASKHNSSALLPQVSAENTQESNSIRVLEIIRAEGSIAHSRLLGKTRFLKTAERTEILASLESEGRIKSTIEITVTKSAKIYQFLR